MTWTELHDACVHQDEPHVIQLAHEHSEQALRVDDHGLTPLHILILGNPTIDALQALVEASPQAVKDRDVHGDTPLHLACGNSKVGMNMVRLLLDACPEAAKIANVEGLMPLHCACRYVPLNKDVIQLLVAHFQDARQVHIKVGSPPPRKHSTGTASSKGGTTKVLHDIVNPAAGLDTSSIVDYRFDAGAVKQVRDGAYPLHMAIAANAPLSVIQLLITEEVLLKCNKFGETPLHVALSGGQVSDDIVLALIRHGPNALNLRDKTHSNLPIHVAATTGCSLAVAQALLEQWPGLVEERNDAHMTPLELAKMHGKCSEEVVHFLERMHES